MGTEAKFGEKCSQTPAKGFCLPFLILFTLHIYTILNHLLNAQDCVLHIESQSLASEREEKMNRRTQQNQ